jgi:hypothetical protein
MTTFEFIGGLFKQKFHFATYDILYRLISFKILYQMFNVCHHKVYMIKMKKKIPIENAIASGSAFKNIF